MKKSVLIFSAIILCFLSFSCKQERTKEVWYAERPPFNPPTYVCYKTPGIIKIDGKLSSDEWDAIPWTNDFVDIEGDLQPQPYLKTRAKMSQDDKGMYFAIEIEEPHVWANIIEHDAVIFQDNDFEIFLNPTNDTHNYLEYEVNALGTEWDLYLSKPYRDNPIVLNNWEFAGMQSAIHIEGTLNNPNDTDKYWSAEIFIPWQSIYQVMRREEKPMEGEQMRVNFSRVQWATEIQDGKYIKIPIPGEDKIREHNWVWAPTGIINIHLPEYWGYVQFTDKIAGTADVPFTWNTDEDIKWMLRQLYYRQREYRQAFDQYASNLADLKPEEICKPELIKKLKVTTTPSMYEITLPIENDIVWHIREDGLVWSTIIIKKAP